MLLDFDGYTRFDCTVLCIQCYFLVTLRRMHERTLLTSFTRCVTTCTTTSSVPRLIIYFDCILYVCRYDSMKSPNNVLIKCRLWMHAGLHSLTHASQDFRLPEGAQPRSTRASRCREEDCHVSVSHSFILLFSMYCILCKFTGLCWFCPVVVRFLCDRGKTFKQLWVNIVGIFS